MIRRPRSTAGTGAPSAATAASAVTGSPLGPDAVEVRPRSLAVGGGVCRTLAVVGYPREVGVGWLAPLLDHPGRLDVALHVEPVPNPVAAQRLRRQLARFESSRRLDAAKGRLGDPEAEVAAEDARDLAAQVARGEGRLFRVALVVTVWAHDERGLEAECARVRSAMASLLLDPVPATFRTLQGWLTTLPVGVDLLGLRRTLDTQALAAGFPFSGTDLDTPGGPLYGTTTAGSGVLRWDRFSQDNFNSVILARSGSGKSYLAKLEILRSLYRGIEALVVDPEDEYRRLAEAVGGVTLGLGSRARLNPFDLAPGPEPFTRRALFIHTLVAVLLGESPDPPTTAALDEAVLATYAGAGITADPRTHARPAPVLADLARTLSASEQPAGRTLANRLTPFVSGSFRGLFDGPTTVRPEGHLVVFSLRDLPDEQRAVGTLLALDAIWHRVADPGERRRRLVTVDEGWLLLGDRHGAEFLFRAAKAARKHWAGLTVVTQDAADVLGSDLGRAVVANAATQVLLRQAPQTMDLLAERFALSDGERQFLLGAARGEGLLCAGAERVAFSATASDEEHRLVTSDPAELAALDPELEP